MSIYYTGIILANVVTGFGGYTGISLINSGNFPVKYTASISETTLQGINVSTEIIAGSNKNTLYITDDLNDVNINDSTLDLTVNPSESGIFYVTHKPFTNFTTSFKSTGVIAGNETARITINSLSSIGDTDNDIIIDVTGKRVSAFTTPPRIGAFYAVEDYSSTNSFFRNFYWQVINPGYYVTGFNLQISQATNFSSPTTYQYSVSTNSDVNFPLYGNYQGLYNTEFNRQITNLTLNQNYYARIQGVNNAGVGDYSYCTGFDNYNVKLDGSGYSGLYPTPGGNLLLSLKKMNLTRVDDYEIDFDLYEFLVNQNKNSLDFSKYSGVNIKFISASQGLCKYIASSKTKGAINFNVPQNAQLIFGQNSAGRFSIEMEFENCGLFGHGGDGLKWVGASPTIQPSDYNEPTDGGPIFNLDNYSYSNIPIDYYIYKDVDSVFYAGPGGGKGWVINQNNTDILDLTSIRIDGVKIIDLSDSILTSQIP